MTRVRRFFGYGWAEPVPRRYAVVLSALWYVQRYTRFTGTYHRVWAAARAVR